MAEKNGIGFVGNVIVDCVYEVIDPGALVYSDGARYLTGEDMESENVQYSTGGMVLNDSIDCSKMNVSYPIRVVGKIGSDDNGRLIRESLCKNGISDKFLIETPDHPTSVTHVYYVKDAQGNVNRAFRHYFGAMGDFGPDDMDYSVLGDLKIVIVGYCLLLPLFDRPDDHYGAAIGKTLERLKEMGVVTCIDFVTPKREKIWKFKRFAKTLRWVDILSIGEDQAWGITGISEENQAVKSLVEDYGVGTAIVHCGDKGTNYLYNKKTGLITQRIFEVPPEEYKGNNGAGDAFTTGFLHGYHQGWDEKKSLKYATAAAAISLNSLTCSDAMREEAYILDYMETRPVKK